MQTDVKAATFSSTDEGTELIDAPVRVKGLVVSAENEAAVEFTDGNGGPTLMLIEMPANATNNPMVINVPGEGVRFMSAVYANALTNVASVTVFYG